MNRNDAVLTIFVVTAILSMVLLFALPSGMVVEDISKCVTLNEKFVECCDRESCTMYPKVEPKPPMAKAQGFSDQPAVAEEIAR